MTPAEETNERNACDERIGFEPCEFCAQPNTCTEAGGCARGFEVKPRIFFDNGRWHVFLEGWPIHGYLLRENAYIRAETIWSKSKK